MSKNTETGAPKQKKNIGYRLLAALFFIACVAALFLPLSTYTVAWGFEDGWAIEKATLVDTVQALLASEAKMFGVLPVLLEGTGILVTCANLALYLFVIAIVLALVISFFAIVSRKNSPRRIRRAVFIFTWGAAAYALSILCITSYLHTVKITYDLYSTVLAIVGAVIYFILMLAKLGKTAWVNAVQFILSLTSTALLILALTYEGRATAKVISSESLYKTLLLAVVVIAMLNLFIASIRSIFAKGLRSDMVRYIIQLLIALLTCYVSYAGKMNAKYYLLFAICAAVVSLLQIVIANLQLESLAKKNAELVKEEALAGFETEEYVEAYEYEGGPIAGVEVAEEVMPTMAAANGTQPDLASLVGNGFDPFMFTLSNEEKAEFVDLYILRCKGLMPEIPAYVVGDTNKNFFNSVFIYLGQHREKISSGLLQKMYDYSLKL